MGKPKIGETVCGRRTITGERVVGRLERLFNDGEALIASTEQCYTVRANTLFRPMAR
jgi:hypothetical protein